MPGWPSRSLTGGVWSMNVFPDVDFMLADNFLLDDDIQRVSKRSWLSSSRKL